MFQKRGTPKEYSGFFAENKSLVAISLLIGTIVGAGILGIPYVVSKVGFLYGAILIIVSGIAFMFLNLFFGEIVLRTKKQHQLPGYAEKYLGRTGKWITTLVLVLGIYGALTAYLLGEGAILYSIFNIGSPLLFSLLFFVIFTFIVSRGLKATGRTESFLILFLLIVIVAGGIFSYRSIDLTHFSGSNLSFIFLAYGVIIFALKGLPAIPEMSEELGKDKTKLKKVIIIGSLIPVVLYLIFTFVVMGIIGVEQFDALAPNERIATIALSYYSSPLFSLFANIIAILGMVTSYLTLGTALVESYQYDFGFSKAWALLLTFSIPLLVVIRSFASFLTLLGLTGAIVGGMESIILLFIYWKAKKEGDRQPEYSLPNCYLFGTIMILIFVVGIVHELWRIVF